MCAFRIGIGPHHAAVKSRLPHGGTNTISILHLADRRSEAAFWGAAHPSPSGTELEPHSRDAPYVE